MNAVSVVRLCALAACLQKSMAGIEAPKKNVKGSYTTWWEFDDKSKNYDEAAAVCSKNTWAAGKQCGADGAALINAATQGDLIKSAYDNFGKHGLGTGPTTTETRGNFFGVDKTKLYTINGSGIVTSAPLGETGNASVKAGFICVKMNSVCNTTTMKKTTAKKTTAKKTTAGKVTFKTTRSKKDAGKVTKKEVKTTVTTTTNNLPKVDAHKVEGSITMTVPDADKAIKDTKFKQAVIDGLAASSKCPAKYITVKLTKARRLSTSDRRLAVIVKTLKVAYTMTIPAKNPTKTAQDKVLADMKAIKVADLTKSIQTKVTAAKGKDYKITVSAKSSVTSTKIKIDAPTTAKPVTSSAMNGGVQGILMIVSTLSCTLLF